VCIYTDIDTDIRVCVRVCVWQDRANAATALRLAYVFRRTRRRRTKATVHLRCAATARPNGGSAALAPTHARQTARCVGEVRAFLTCELVPLNEDGDVCHRLELKGLTAAARSATVLRLGRPVALVRSALPRFSAAGGHTRWGSAHQRWATLSRAMRPVWQHGGRQHGGRQRATWPRSFCLYLGMRHGARSV
jgi:hypothetical protein